MGRVLTLVEVQALLARRMEIDQGEEPAATVLLVNQDDGAGSAYRTVVAAEVWTEHRGLANAASADDRPRSVRWRGGREVAVLVDEVDHVTVLVSQLGDDTVLRRRHVTVTSDQAWWLVQALLAAPRTLGYPPYLDPEVAAVGPELTLRRLREEWRARPDYSLGRLIAEAVAEADLADLGHKPAAPAQDGRSAGRLDSIDPLSGRLAVLHDLEDDDLIGLVAALDRTTIGLPDPGD